MPEPANHAAGKGSSGQALVEYTLILLLFTIVLILVVTTLGQTNNNGFVKVNNSLDEAGYGK